MCGEHFVNMAMPPKSDLLSFETISSLSKFCGRALVKSLHVTSGMRTFVST